MAGGRLHTDPVEEHRILEEHLKRALEEASAKTTSALDFAGKTVKEQEMAVWLAMESVEYTSYLFSLTNDFEDVDPDAPTTKGMNLLSLIKKSAKKVREVRSSKGTEKLLDYTRLRDAVHYLRTAYLEFRKRPKGTRQNLTRS